ncbi:MAG: GNAT family N-acetyltransferase [Solirubrobacteraceae bacterium]|jgi:ribosomal-protein-alanine N-acetyltransferase
MRRWNESDLDAFAALNADPVVMEYFPAPLSFEECAFVLEQIEAGFDQRGFGIWALEQAGDGTFIGLTGLSVVPFAAHFTPAVEVGWRLLPAAWGHGYATEAATASIDYGFGQAGLSEIVSFASQVNARSLAVMRRLGMHSDGADDFDHPQIPLDSPLCRHVLYRLRADEWRGGTARAVSPATRGSDPRR